MNIKYSSVSTLIRTVFIYLFFMIFALWMSSVIESFVPIDSRWLIIVSQAFYVIKITVILGLSLIPLLLFVKNPLIGRTGIVIVLIILIYILVKSNIAFIAPNID